MRYMKGMSSKRVVDSKDWLNEHYDVMKEREQMKRSMDARGIARKRLEAERILKRYWGE